MDSNIQLNSTSNSNKNARTKSNNTNSNFMIIDDEYQSNSSPNNTTNKKKWKCSQCTYENFPSSIKCTLCCSINTTRSNNSNSRKKNLISGKKLNNSSIDLSNTSSTPLYEIELLDNRKLIKQKEIELHNEINYKFNNLKLNNNNNNNNNDNSENNDNLVDSSSHSDSSAISSLNNNDETVNQQVIDSNKWSCTTCTYLNWPKSMKCIQCYSAKPTESLSSSSTENSGISVSNGDIIKKSNNNESTNLILLKNQHTNSPITNRSQCNSPCTVPKVEIKPSNNNSDNNNNSNIEPNNLASTTPPPTTTTTTVIIDSSTKKWPCSVCTYQNWPKSQRCVMCHLPRYTNNNQANSTSPTIPISNNTTSNFTNKKPNNTAQVRQNIINIKINDSVNNTNNNLNQQQQKIINYQLKMDRLFLSACQGVVDADLTNLNLYVSTGGDLTRCLTSEECKILNKKNPNNQNSENSNSTNNAANSNIFFPGLTLIHLCYQFKRKDILIKLLNQSNTLKKLYLNNSNNNKTITLNNTLNNMKNNYYNNMLMNNNKTNINKSTKMLKNVNRTKFSPCQSCPALASNIIDRYFSSNLRQRKTTIDYTLTSFGGGAVGQQRHQNSPTSSLITLNQLSCCGQSPSPSPPPYGAAGTLHHLHHHYPHYFNNNHQSLCFYVNDVHTFTLPNEIEDFSPRIQNILFDELLDRDVQNELEMESRIINWNMDLCNRLNSRLYPLWNRHSGDCLLDSVLQACYGVFDTENTLRRVMAESLEQYSNCFKPRWKEHEILMAQSLDYKLDDYQLEQDWNNIISLANQPGASLEQAHIFALCHIFRRPIIVYSVRVIKSFRGENIGFTHFEGVYLPLIWEPNFCFKTPIALGYTRGHFTALVPLERSPEIVYPYYNSSQTSSNSLNSSGLGTLGASSSNNLNTNISVPNNHNISNSASNNTNSLISNSSNNIASGYSVAGAINTLSNSNINLNGSNNNLSNILKDNNHSENDNINSTSVNDNNNNSSVPMGAVSYIDQNENQQQQQVFYLPLTNNEGQLLPIHFLNSSELGREKSILRQYLNLDCLVIPGSNCALLVAQQRVVKQGMLVKQMLDEWLNYYKGMQAKDYSHQIEISQDKENDMINMDNMCNLKNIHLINNNTTKIRNNINNNSVNNNSNNTNSNNVNNDDEEDEDDEDEYEDEEDDDEDDDDDEDEEDYEDNEYCEEINVQ